MSITIEELDGKFGLVSTNSGQQVVNSIIVNRVWTKLLYCEGLITANGYQLINGGSPTGNIALNDGSAAAPSLFFSSVPQAGLYLDGTSIGFASGGTKSMSVGSTIVIAKPITSDSGLNLSLNSSTGVIDMNGTTLINVNGITTNPNRYEVIAPATISTTDATPTILYNISTVSDAAYTIITDITCVDDINNVSSAGFTISAKAKNVGGVVTVSGNMEINSAIDTPLIGITVDHISNGTNIAVNVIGKLATTIKWFGATTITRQLF